MKHFNYFLSGLCLLFFVAACNSGDGYKKTDNGLKYQIHNDASGDNASIGDFLKMHISYATMEDSLIYSTFRNNRPLELKLSNTLFRGALNQGFENLSEGDSATFVVVADSVYGDNLPKYLNAGDQLKYTVKMISVASEADIKREREAKTKTQRADDDKAIKAYIEKNGLKAERLESGLYYVIDEPGSGANPTKGQTVKVHYTGTLLDGSKFDSSKDRNRPFEFPLGQGRVIQGWDTGIPLFKKGGKGTLLIPSHLGYGERAMGAKIPAYSVLVFDIELLDFN